MDARKILKDLQYRIDTAPDTDPEKENAIRLRDRLLAKNGLRLEDITEVRTERTFDKLSHEESSMVCQYFRKKMKIKFDEAPWSLRDAMAAAKALSDTLFPQMQVEQETLRLAKGA